MKLSRLDEITKNNVGSSTQKKIDEQILFVLQDISTTLAMIYDKSFGDILELDSSEIDGSEIDGSKIDNKEENNAEMPPMLLQFEELRDYNPIHFESIDYPEGYPVTYKSDITYSETSPITYESSVAHYARLLAFGEEMDMPESKYGKTWRCWTKEPSKEQREKAKWRK